MMSIVRGVLAPGLAAILTVASLSSAVWAQTDGAPW